MRAIAPKSAEPAPREPAPARPGAQPQPGSSAGPAAVRARLGAGAPLDPWVRARMERGLGASLGDVRVHTGAAAGGAARGLGALAFAVGSDVAFAPGEYRPGTLRGDAILAHELAHTLQQRGRPDASDSASGPALEAEADAAAAGALGYGPVVAVRGGRGLRLQRCEEPGTPASPQQAPANQGAAQAPPQAPGQGQTPAQAQTPAQGQTPTQGQSPAQGQPPATAPGTTTPTAPTVVPAVVTSPGVTTMPSVNRLKRLGKVREGQWKEVGRAYRQRLDFIEGLIKGEKDAAKLAALAAMRGRFAKVKQALDAGIMFDPGRDPLPFLSTVDAELTQDETDAAAVGNRVLEAMVKQLRRAVTELVKERKLLEEEIKDFQRFDPLFVLPGNPAAKTPGNQAQVEHAEKLKTLLDAIQPPLFTPAHIKALMAQETGDFLAAGVAGLPGKTTGIPVKSKPPDPSAAVVGVGQMMASARDPALKWAAARGVTIPDKPDPRKEVASSVLLVAAALGHISEYLRANLPAPLPAGAEFRAFVFAGYNWSPDKLVAKVKSLGLGKTPYGWDDIKDRVPEETRKYVGGIRIRVGP